MEAEAPKSYPPGTALFSDDIARNLPELIEGLSPEIPIEEKLVEEVMQELYKEITTGGSSTKPSSTAECFPAKSLFTGNEKSESCGAFVSDSASTVMAGIGFVGYAGKMVGSPEIGGWSEWRNNLGEGGSVVEKGGMDGCDRAADGVVDDEWIERVLSTWGPVDLESWL